MESSLQAHHVHLGQCSFRAIDSCLQLRFTATAQLTQHYSFDSLKLPTGISQWQDLANVWMTEAPELDIRLFVKVGSSLEHTAYAFLGELGEMMCNSAIWSNLGFVARHKSSEANWDIESPWNYCILISLCRPHHMNTSNKGRNLPATLQNPSEAHAPPGIPVAKLASIDIQLEYEYPPRPTQKFCDLLAMHVEPMMAFDCCEDRPKMVAFAVAALRVTEREPETVDLELDLEEFATLSPGSEGFRDSNASFSMWLQLLDLGLQKLINSACGRRPDIRILSKEDTLQSLPRLFPAIFNPGYCEAMNQRAVSIPIISKALTSILKNSDNPISKDKLSAIQQNTESTSESSTLPRPPSPQSTIHSLLWRIAQNQVRHKRPLRRGTSFFAIDADQDILIDEPIEPFEPDLFAEELLPLPDSYINGQPFGLDFTAPEFLIHEESEDVDLIVEGECNIFDRQQHTDVDWASYPHDVQAADDELELILDW